MKYSNPEIRIAASAIAAVQQQVITIKGWEFLDRNDPQLCGGFNVVADAAAYESDESVAAARKPTIMTLLPSSSKFFTDASKEVL